MHVKHLRAFLPFICAICLLAGCKDERRHDVGRAIELTKEPAVLPAKATPIEVAQAALTEIAEIQNARSKGLGQAEVRKSYNDAMARLASLAASKEIHQQVRQSGGGMIPKSIDETGALTLAMESWTSTLAHYVNGYKWNSIAYKAGPSTSSAVVRLEAENPAEAQKLAELTAQSGSALSDGQLREKALKMGFNIPITVGIDVRLVKVADQWRVLRIELAPAATPATHPVTNTQPH